MLTPGTASVVHNMQGTIYEKVVDATYTYHMHAPITNQASKAKAVWTIWREHTADGHLTCPTDGTNPTPDKNIATDPTILNYWSTV